jgi:aliphatic nitrilase
MKIDNTKKAELFKKLYHNSVEVPSKTTEVICDAAKRNNIMVVVGVNELGGSTIYNAQLFVSPSGEIIGKHRKLMPTSAERTVWGWGDGSDLKVFDTELGRIGGLICWEHSMLLSKFALFAMGEQVHIACWPGIGGFRASPRDRNSIIDAAIRDITFEGQVFCINSCSCVSKEEVQFYIDLESSNRGVVESGGGLVGIVDPMGNYIAGPITNDERIVYAEIDLEKIILAKHMVDSVGHYSRSDVASLRLNLRENVPFSLVGELKQGVDLRLRDEEISVNEVQKDT